MLTADPIKDSVAAVSIGVIDGKGIFDRVGGDKAATEPAARGFDQRDISAGDRRRSRSAVGLDHIAINPDRALAQAFQIGNCAQAPTDEPLDLMRAPADLPREDSRPM